MPRFSDNIRISEARQVPRYGANVDILAFVNRCVEVANWCGGDSYMMHTGLEPGFYYAGDPGHDRIVVSTPDGEKDARPGDWIAKDDAGRFWVLAADVYRVMQS